MKRRKLLKASIGGGATIALMGGGVVWLNIDPGKGPLTIDAALAKLKLLSNKSVASLGEWDPTQVFTHCAQSVEYSMTGFPQHKSAAFKNTLGALAFSAFSSKGRMTHGLNEPIPGAPALPSKPNINSALQRLKMSMVDFKQYQGALSAHFAYGTLSKEEYETAHVIHLYNHLQEIEGNAS
jgi:hypothetical protein